ncbi:MAG: 5-carboxymethyl-2-hydroxymuconate isomerase [Actinomycetota bacterium]
MPHVTIEYSSNVADHHDIGALVDVVHRAALDHGLPPLDGLRTRAAERAHYQVADGDPDYGFVAIHVRIGPGREPEAKQSFMTVLLDAAEERVAAESSPLHLMWSIEITEIDPEFRINRNHVRSHLQAKQLPENQET